MGGKKNLGVECKKGGLTKERAPFSIWVRSC